MDQREDVKLLGTFISKKVKQLLLCPFYILPDLLKRDRNVTGMASLITFCCQRKHALKEQ